MNRFGKADVCNGIVQRNIGRDKVFKEYIVFFAQLSLSSWQIFVIMQRVEMGETRSLCRALRTSVGLNKSNRRERTTFNACLYIQQIVLPESKFASLQRFLFFRFVFDSFFSEGQPGSESQRSSKCAAFA